MKKNEITKQGTEMQTSVQLVTRYGNAFTKRNLYHFIDFYRLFPNIFHAGSGKFSNEQIVNSLRSQSMEAQFDILNSLRAKSPIRLSWTHYRIILQELTAEGRAWYENEAANEMWHTIPSLTTTTSFSLLNTLPICQLKKSCAER